MPRNPFGVEDVPQPDGDDVAALASSLILSGSDDDPNASSWSDIRCGDQTSIRGRWSSRWRGEGLDWHVGHGELHVDGESGRVFVLFDWDDGAKRGLIEAHRQGPDRLVGKYLNLSAPRITRPWVGLIVDSARIDGKYPGGRIDFRR
jgi:hypothetical protein